MNTKNNFQWELEKINFKLSRVSNELFEMISFEMILKAVAQKFAVKSFCPLCFRACGEWIFFKVLY